MVREGDVLAGRYRLGRELGRGGMGTVWEAVDERLRRPVAVKEIVAPAELTQEQRKVLHQRTLREARAAARITCSSAVAVFDVVEADGKPWIVMQRLHPRTLADVLAEHGPLSPPDAARIGLRVVEALDAAHRAGVLHRDVKPGNIMVTPEGEGVLTDFGIAVLDGDATLTTTGSLLGSPAYLAPERARGAQASAASDLWSLGATLYAAVEGRSPFQREGQLATLAAVITDEPAPSSHAGPLRSIIDELLQKDPHARPSAPQVRAALQRVLDSHDAANTTADLAAAAALPVHAARLDEGQRTTVLPVADPPGRPSSGGGPGGPPRDDRPAQPRRRGPVIAALAGLAALVLTGWLLFSGEDPAEPGAAPVSPAQPTAEPTAEEPGTGAAEAAPDAEEQPQQREQPRESEEPAGAPEPEATSAQPDPGTEDEADAVPAGYQRYTDTQGWSTAIPEGWEVIRREGTRVDLGSGDGPFLRVDSTDQPASDPVADWTRQEQSVSQRLPGYERVRIEESDFRGWDAADWEFTFEPDGGTIRVINRGFVVDEAEAHALYYSAPEGEFDPEVLEVASGTFTPSGG